MSNEWMDSLFSSPTAQGGVPAVDAYGKNMAAGMAQGASAAGNFGASGMASYMADYQPYDKKLMAHVDNLGTDAYRAQQRGQAMTDVGIQTGNAQQALNRNMARMGVNPNSAAFASSQGQLALQGALGKAQASMAADRGARDEYVKGLGAINAMGNKLSENSVKAMSVAGDLGKTGMIGADLGAAAYDRNTNAQASMAGAAASGASAAAAGRNADTAALNAANTYQLGLGRLALDRYNIDNTTAINKNNNSFSTIAGSTLAGYAARYGSDALFNYVKSLGSGGGSSYTNLPGDANMPGAATQIPDGSVLPGLEQYVTIPAANPYPTEE